MEIDHKSQNSRIEKVVGGPVKFGGAPAVVGGPAVETSWCTAHLCRKWPRVTFVTYFWIERICLDGSRSSKIGLTHLS